MRTLIHTLKYFGGFASPITQVSANELALLKQFAKNSDVLVEVGTYEGSTTRGLAECTSGHIFTIDVFYAGRLGICYPEIIARHHCRSLKNVTILKGASTVIASAFTTPVDFLFIDADHSFDAVKADCATWFPKVRRGGIIALHDCKFTERMPEPQGSWDFYDNEIKKMTDFEEISSIESLVVLRKKQAPERSD